MPCACRRSSPTYMRNFKGIRNNMVTRPKRPRSRTRPCHRWGPENDLWDTMMNRLIRPVKPSGFASRAKVLAVTCRHLPRITGQNPVHKHPANPCPRNRCQSHRDCVLMPRLRRNSVAPIPRRRRAPSIAHLPDFPLRRTPPCHRLPPITRTSTRVVKLELYSTLL